MSSAPQSRSIFNSNQSVVTSRPGKFSDSLGTASAFCRSILLVGRNGAWGSSVLQSLEKLGYELFLMPPEAVTPEFVRENEHELILLDSTVSPEQRRMLTTELIGSRTTLFYSFPVENGCWWLPALMRGEDSHGAPAIRRKDFPQELERILGKTTAEA